jgi:hypothetical protein
MNRVCIEPTRFTDVRTGAESFGFRAWDDYGQTYGNTMTKIPNDDLEFLELVLENSDDEVLGDMIDYCLEYEKGIYIGPLYYDWDKVGLILRTHYE